MGSDQVPGDAPRVRRKSLSTEQIRDPLGTLATAYGVEREFDHVVAAVAGRLPADVGGLSDEAQFGAVAGLVLLGPFIHVPRTPADPFGDEAYWHGASYGGLIGLAIAVYRLAIRRRDT